MTISRTCFTKFVTSNTASTSGTLPSNTVTNPKEDLKGITTRSGVAYKGPTIPITSSPKVMECETEVTKDTMPPTNNGSTEDVQPLVVPVVHHESISEPVNAPVSASMPNQKTSIPFPSRRNDERRREKANDQIEKFYEIFRDLSFEISFTDALMLMPKFASTLKTLNKLPKKLGDPGRFLIPCEFSGINTCNVLWRSCAALILCHIPLKIEEKAALIEVLKSHKRAIAWKLSDIKGIDQSFVPTKFSWKRDTKPDVFCIKGGLWCDASDFAIGESLGNDKTRHFQPIHYASKTMTEAQAHYTTTEKELLAVVYAFEKFWSYLILSKSIVYTDHSAIKYLFTIKGSLCMTDSVDPFAPRILVIIRDKTRAVNLDVDHLYRHFANYHAGNFIVKGMSSQQKNKFFKDVKKPHLHADGPLLFKIYADQVFVLDSFWPLIYKRCSTEWLLIVTRASDKDKFHKGMKCPKMLSKCVKSLVWEASLIHRDITINQKETNTLLWAVDNLSNGLKPKGKLPQTSPSVSNFLILSLPDWMALCAISVIVEHIFALAVCKVGETYIPGQTMDDAYGPSVQVEVPAGHDPFTIVQVFPLWAPLSFSQSRPTSK
ncbi:reverse transcriptase domain-containing protein [Tanacetum coccineum]